MSASAVFTPAILSPRLHSVPRWANMSNQVQPSHKLGQQKGLTVLKMGNKRRLLVVTRCWRCKDDGCHHQLMMDACKQGRRRGWALEVTINKCTFAAAAVRLRCIVRWLNINAMLCWKLSSLEVAWPARAYTLHCCLDESCKEF